MSPAATRSHRLPTRLGDLRAALTALMAERRWAGDADGVVLAVQEAVVNALRHGQGVREVAAVWHGGDLVVEVADRGSGFDPAGYLAHPPDVLAEAGRGLWLMGQLASAVELDRESPGARLRLRFGSDGRPGVPATGAADVPGIASLGMEPLAALGGAALLVDARLVVRDSAGATSRLLGLDAAALPARDVRGVVAEIKHRFADPAAYESAMLDLLAHPERADGGLVMLATGQFLRQHAVALHEDGSLVGRLLLFTPAASHVQALASFQRALLPSVPSFEGLSLGAIYHPAEASGLVGGDFYDFFDLPTGCGLVVGDVAGRGPFAAAASVTARAYLRATLSASGLTGAVAAVNRALVDELDDEQFVTMAMAMRESRDVWTLTLCGHPSPLLYRDGEVRSFPARGMLLGMRDGGEWGRQLVELRPGDVLLLYTDGVTEAGSLSERFGVDRLAEALRELSHQEPQQLVEAIDARLHSFTGGHTADDHVLVAVRRG